MELKFKNITKCTKDIYNEFLRFHSQKHKNEYLIKAILILFVITYMVIFNIIYKNYMVALIIILMVILVCISREHYRKKNRKKQLKNFKTKNSEDIEFSFYNKYFTTKFNEKKQKVRYYKIHKVCNDEKNFYVYLDKTHAFIINKTGFVKGTPEEFEEFILKKYRFKIVRILKID